MTKICQEGIRLYGPLPPAGSVRPTSQVANVYDKGANALILLEGHCVDATSGQLLADITTGIIVRDDGGFLSRSGARKRSAGVGDRVTRHLPDTEGDRRIV